MFERRLTFVYGAICIALLVLGLKVFRLQVLRISIEDPALVLYPPTPWKSMPAARGAILDRDGNILAADQPKLDLTIHYKDLRYPKYWLRPIQEVTGLGEEELLDRRLSIMKRVRKIRETVLQRHPNTRKRIESGKLKGWRIYEETIAHTIVPDVSLQVAARVQATPERFPGVNVETRLHREYPDGDLAPHVIGRLGKAQRPEPGEVSEDPSITPGDRIGVSGVEKEYDRTLRGERGLFSEGDTSRSFAGANSDPLLGSVPGTIRVRIESRIRKRKDVVPMPAEAGCAIHLTLNAEAQRRANEMLDGLEGAVVVMDVQNGELLVLASAPLDEPWSRAIQSAIPSGSVMKPLVALAAARAEKATPTTTVYCDGSIRLGGHTYRCSHVHGAVDMREAIAGSCNIYFWALGRRIGVDAIADMAEDLGFGRRTGWALPYEKAGHVPRPNSPMNLSVGQGALQVTPIQVAVAMAAIANGGKVLRPRILLKANAQADPAYLPPPRPVVLREVELESAALRAVREGMRRAVVSGTVSRIRHLNTLKVAAKTGTAQTGRHHATETDRELYHGWLAGYVPYDEPRYAFAVVVQNTLDSGANAAGPIAAEVLDVLFAGD